MPHATAGEVWRRGATDAADTNQQYTRVRDSRLSLRAYLRQGNVARIATRLTGHWDQASAVTPRITTGSTGTSWCPPWVAVGTVAIESTTSIPDEILAKTA